VVDPRTRESRGFGFVTMSRVKDADRCIRHLHGSTLEGRIITVEKVRTAWLQTNGNFWWQHGVFTAGMQAEGVNWCGSLPWSIGCLTMFLCLMPSLVFLCNFFVRDNRVGTGQSLFCLMCSLSKRFNNLWGRANAEETYRVSHQVSKVCYFSWQIVTSQLDFEISNSRRSSPQAKAQVNPT
jgi:RNA recognition motif-containing protein